jgi:hypothetical protein
MQCPSCRFENMPGSGYCARCGASLIVGHVDVIPPRASALQRRVPAELRSAFYRLQIAIGDFVARTGNLLPSRLRPTAASSATWRVAAPSLAIPGNQRENLQEFDLRYSDYLRLLIPGWVQARFGEPVRGGVMMAVALLLFALTVVLAGSGYSAVTLGLLFSFHVMASVDASCRHFATFGERVLFTGLCAGLLAVVMYFPVGWSVSQFAQAVTIQQNTRYFQSGDVVWYRPRATATVGDFVLYNVPVQTVAGHRDGLAINVRIEGARINRLVAVAGQHVSVSDGKLFVNGELSHWQPRTLLLPNELIVPQGHVFILPEDLVPANFKIAIKDSVTLAVVPLSSVSGVVAWRTYPFHRFTSL